MSIKKVAILGSTGSIGINTLNVIEAFSDKFKVVGLSAYRNAELLCAQVKRFRPAYVSAGPGSIGYLSRRIDSRKTKILDAESGACEIASMKDVDIVVIGISGGAALLPFLAAVRAGKTVAPANKEAIVMAGEILMAEAQRHRAKIIPVDSEQSAIFQCLQGGRQSELKKIFLTASGGPLWNTAKAKFDKIPVREILKHPRWKMGKKITVDSATLMNKGLEIIEARWLFDVNASRIEVLIHPEAVIHSMVEFKDGSILAQMGVTDMRLPIQYALTYPSREPTPMKGMDFVKQKKLTFAKPDFKKFPSLCLCRYAIEKEGTLPCVLNAANEEAVEAFLKGHLAFSKIYKVVEKVVLRHKNIKKPGLNRILEADRWARTEAAKFILN